MANEFLMDKEILKNRINNSILPQIRGNFKQDIDVVVGGFAKKKIQDNCIF